MLAAPSAVVVGWWLRPSGGNHDEEEEERLRINRCRVEAEMRGEGTAILLGRREIPQRRPSGGDHDEEEEDYLSTDRCRFEAELRREGTAIGLERRELQQSVAWTSRPVRRLTRKTSAAEAPSRRSATTDTERGDA